MAENKQALSNNNFILLSVLVTLLVVLGTGFIMNKLVKQAVLNNKVVSKKSAANKQLQENIAILSNLEQQYVAMGSKSQLILAALPTKPDFPSIVSMLEVVAGSSGVKLKTASPTTTGAASPAVAATPTVANGSQSYQYGASIEGSYDNVLKFLGNIELSARPTKLISFTQTGSTSTQMVEASFQTYYQATADLTPKTEVVK